jgi:hypothetical protein
MISPRDAIYNALLALLAANAPFATTSRKFRMWSSVPPEEQPALFLRAGPQRSSEDRTFGLPKWTLKCWAFIYVLHDAGSQVPGTTLMQFLDIVDANMAPPQPGGLQTLGNLVTNAFISGDVIVDEGALPMDNQSLAVVPIDIIVGADCAKY